jgi:hypothetical protein
VDNHDPHPRRPDNERAFRDGRVLPDARARVLADLAASGLATAASVSALEDAVEERRWWAAQWPEGHVYVAGLVAQDVQDAVYDRIGRWPLCPQCTDLPEHALYIYPELGGPDPRWVCEKSGTEVAELGRLGSADEPFKRPSSTPPTPPTD